MPRVVSPEVVKGEAVLAREDVLANDGWISGPELLYEMMSVIPPGEAQRAAMERVKDPEKWSTQDLINSGRRSRAVRKITQMFERGVWVSDPPKMTRDHWAGHMRWKAKALFPGAIGMPDAADEIGVSLYMLDDWISKGLAPDGFRAPGAPIKTMRLVTPQLLETYRRIAELRPVPGRREWKSDPRAVWQKPTAQAAAGVGNEIECPHCSGLIVVETVVRAAPADGSAGGSAAGGSAAGGSAVGWTPDGVIPQPTARVPAEAVVGNAQLDNTPQDAQDDPQDVPDQPGAGSDSVVIDGQERFALRSGRALDETLVKRMEDAVRAASRARASMVDGGAASHG